MKIGMLIDRYKPYISGITNYIVLNKAELERSGVEVYVFTFGDLDFADTETNIIRSQGMPLVDSGYYLSLSYNKAARRLLYSMDLVHVHHPFLSGSMAMRYCKSRGIPIIFTNHTRYDLYTQAYLPMLPDVFGETLMRSFLPTFCRQCDLVIAPSPGLKKILQQYSVDSPIEVVPNGVDLSPYKPSLQPKDRQGFGIQADDVLLVYLGRLGPEKNLPFLLRAFGGAASAYENVHLMLIGDGPERANLEDRVRYMGLSQRIHFTGQVPYEQVPGYLAMADAFATASITEVHPFSVIEAMAAGLPVLGIDSPGVGDSVEDGVSGLITSDDIAAFTAQMVHLLSENDLRKQMGQAARQAALRFDIAKTNELMLTQYKRVIDQAASPRRGWRAKVTRLIDRWGLR